MTRYARAQKLQARRADALGELAKLQDRQQLAAVKADPAKIESFCKLLKERMADPESGLGKAYLRLLVSEIRADGEKLTMRGSYGQLSEAFGQLEKMKLGEVPSPVERPDT